MTFSRTFLSVGNWVNGEREEGGGRERRKWLGEREKDGKETFKTRRRISRRRRGSNHCCSSERGREREVKQGKRKRKRFRRM